MTEPTAAPPPRSRGVIALDEDACTVCMICVRECPDWCIYIEGHAEHVPADATAPGSSTAQSAAGRRPRSENVLDRFAIDFGLCMYCGICVDVCPFDALFWSPEYSYAQADLVELTGERERLIEWLPTVPPPVPLDAGAEPPPVGERDRRRRPA
jgi:NADH-quinone oxidoreductase subunit I